MAYIYSSNATLCTRRRKAQVEGAWDKRSFRPKRALGLRVSLTRNIHLPLLRSILRIPRILRRRGRRQRIELD